jgi:hypothetical protein
MRLVNLTPHPIHILEPPYTHNDVILTIPTSGVVVSCKRVDTYLGYVETNFGVRIDITNTKYEEPGDDLPPTKPGTLYVVSSIVAKHAVGRVDLLVVNGLIRNTQGRVIGCKSLTPGTPHI